MENDYSDLLDHDHLDPLIYSPEDQYFIEVPLEGFEEMLQKHFGQ